MVLRQLVLWNALTCDVTLISLHLTEEETEAHKASECTHCRQVKEAGGQDLGPGPSDSEPVLLAAKIANVPSNSNILGFLED